MSQAAGTALRMEGITQDFGSVRALDQVTFQASSGKIQALVGENGAGKTTLMRILHGSLAQTSGRVQLTEPSAKVGMVSQHYAIIPELTCLENLMLGCEPGPWIDLAASEARAKGLADQMGFSFDWKSPASNLGAGESQKLEILKLLWRESQIMILDEPTAMLSPDDGEALYQSLRQLAGQGRCIIVVTHRLSEVMDHCSEVTVLRQGKLIDFRPVSEVTTAQIAEMIVGHGLEPAKITPPTKGASVLSLKQVSLKDERKSLALKEVSLDLRAGEMVGIAGVDGSGQKELFQAILGLRPLADGAIQILGAPAPATTRERLALGMRAVPEDRLEEGVIPSWSLELNGVLGLQRRSEVSQGPWVNREARRSWAEAAAKLFSTRHGGLDLPMSSLSGGNQQRFAAGRAMSPGGKIHLAFQPARGLDIDGTAQIYQELRRQCREEGAAALVVSFDLDELIDQCDRILVMFRGRLSGPPAGLERDRQAIGRLMVGEKA